MKASGLKRPLCIDCQQWIRTPGLRHPNQALVENRLRGCPSRTSLPHRASCSRRVSSLHRSVLIPLVAFGVSVLLPAAPATITTLTPTSQGLALDWADDGTSAAYAVQFRETLTDGLWLLAPSVSQPWPVSEKRWADPEATAGAGRFYRVLTVEPAQRGLILATNKIESLTKAVIAIMFDYAGIPVTPEYDVDCHLIRYETIGPLGDRTQASGVLVVPVNAGAPLPLISYQHGTLVHTNDAPSVAPFERLAGVGFASTGYAVVIPDYLGLGSSPGLHPYHHAWSEATVAVDLLRAARTWCAANGVALTGQLFLAGYSQGGHATMALHRELEAYHTAEFTVTGSAPMAGAYDLSGVTAADLLSGRAMPNPYYFLYLLGAYQDVYHLTNRLADLLVAPYDTALPPLLDGNHSGSAINTFMPAVVTQIFRPGILETFQTNPQHPLRLALRDNDLYRWTPKAPMRMYHCHADRDVIHANSEVALASFHERGATHVELHDPLPGQEASHGDGAIPAFLAAREWFETLRR